MLALAAFDPYQIQKYARMAGTKALDLVSLVPSGKAPEEALDLAREAVDGDHTVLFVSCAVEFIPFLMLLMNKLSSPCSSSVPL